MAIGGLDQRLQDVAGWRRLGPERRRNRRLAPPIDLALHDATELAERVGELEIAIGFGGQQRERARVGYEVLVGVAEDCTQHDFQRHFAQFARDVDRIACVGRQALRETAIRGHDVVQPALHGGAMKGRLDRLALCAPQRAVAGHQSVAEQDRDALDADALAEIGVVVDQHVPDMIRVRQHVEVLAEKRRMHAECIAVRAEKPGKLRKRVIAERSVDVGDARRTRGQCGCGHERIIFGGNSVPRSGATRWNSAELCLQKVPDGPIIAVLRCFLPTCPARQRASHCRQLGGDPNGKPAAL